VILANVAAVTDGPRQKENMQSWSTHPIDLDNLVDTVGSVPSALEFVYAANGLKPCCMARVSPVKLSRLREICRATRLHLQVSDYKVVVKVDTFKADFANRRTTVSANSPDGAFEVFASQDSMDAQLAKYHRANSHDLNMARLCGYPSCCCDFYRRHVARAASENMDFVRYALADTRQYDFYTNRAIRYFGVDLLSHFPCSLDCPASRRIGEERFDLLQRLYPDVADRFSRALRSMVIYTENQGVFFSTDYCLKGDTITYRHIQGSMKNDLCDSLKAANVMTVHSYDKLVIGGRVLDGPVGLLLFK
jgi:hypothetical protein